MPGARQFGQAMRVPEHALSAVRWRTDRAARQCILFCAEIDQSVACQEAQWQVLARRCRAGHLRGAARLAARATRPECRRAVLGAARLTTIFEGTSGSRSASSRTLLGKPRRRELTLDDTMLQVPRECDDRATGVIQVWRTLLRPLMESCRRRRCRATDLLLLTTRHGRRILMPGKAAGDDVGSGLLLDGAIRKLPQRSLFSLASFTTLGAMTCMPRCTAWTRAGSRGRLCVRMVDGAVVSGCTTDRHTRP